MNKILSYDEYQKKIKNLTTPEEIAAFAQELITPILNNVANNETNIVEEKVEEKIPPAEKQVSIPTKPKYNRRNPYQLETTPKPWLSICTPKV